MLNLRTLSNNLFTVQVFPVQKSSFVIFKEDGTLHTSGQIANAFRGKELVVLFDKKYEFLQISLMMEIIQKKPVWCSLKMEHVKLNLFRPVLLNFLRDMPDIFVRKTKYGVVSD